MAQAQSTNEICRMEAMRLAGEIRARNLSAVEVVDAVLERMDRLEPTLHAFCTPTPDAAREDAKRIDADLTAGGDPGPLAGVPVGIKDLVATKGVRTAMGSWAYADFVPDEDDVVVERLRGGGSQRDGSVRDRERRRGLGPYPELVLRAVRDEGLVGSRAAVSGREG